MHTLKVFYHPDDYPYWLPWREFTRKFEMRGKASELDAGGKPLARPGYAPRVPLGKPSNKCDPETGRSLRRGFMFQVKLEGSGHVLLSRFRIHAQRLVEKATST